MEILCNRDEFQEKRIVSKSWLQKLSHLQIDPCIITLRYEEKRFKNHICFYIFMCQKTFFYHQRLKTDL